MIDTITIMLNQGLYKVLKPEAFTPTFTPINPNILTEKNKFTSKFKRHRSYSLSKNRIGNEVYPVLKIEEGFSNNRYYCNLHITFSCPKILYGENFSELSECNFDPVLNVLINRLILMGVSTELRILKKAQITKVHYCHNIRFNSLHSASCFLSKLSKTSLGMRYENNTKTYSNDGIAVRFHSNVFQIIFYSKYLDLYEVTNRSTDRIKTPRERELAVQLCNEYNGTPPIIRYEVRMNGKRSVKQHLKTACNKEQDLWTFNEVFSVENSQKLLLYYWKILSDEPMNQGVLTILDLNEIYSLISEQIKWKSYQRVFESFGVLSMGSALGVKNVRKLLSQKLKSPSVAQQTWRREKEKVLKLLNRLNDKDESLIETVTQSLLTMQ